MKKLLYVLFSLLIILALSGCKSDADDNEPEETERPFIIAPEEDFEYAVSGGRVNIKKYIGSESAVVIPARIEGLKIDRIAVDFLADSGVKEITFPSYFKNFTGISGCDSLEIIHLPYTLENITDPFRFCLNLKEIDVEEGGAYKTVDGVLYTSDEKTLVAYPCGRTGSFTIPEGVEEIEKFAFSNSSLSEIILPDTLKTIADYSFLDAKRLDKITVPSSVRFIGYSAFSGSGIKEVTLSEGLEEIEGSAFEKTDIKELYIPASVMKCGDHLADEPVPISASYPVEGMEYLTQRENVIFRDETLLEEAFRMAENSLIDIDTEWKEGTVFTDLTGDGFPEAVMANNRGILCFYFYQADSKSWESSDWWFLREYSEDSGISFPVYYLCYDQESDTYSYYSEPQTVLLYGTCGYEETVLYQQRVSFTENGVEAFDLYDDEIRERSESEIIKTFDINKILSEYNFDFNDTYNKFVIVTDRFSEKPNGSVYAKSLTVNGKAVNEYPYYESFYPAGIKLSVTGVDVLRGEKLDGVYYRDNSLVFDNAVIDANGEKIIIRSSGIYPLKVELIGNNKVISDSPCSLFSGDANIVFKGSGSLETPTIRTESSVTLTERAKLIESQEIMSSPMDEYGFNSPSLSLTGDSYIEFRSLNTDSLYLSENSHAEIKKGEFDYVTLSGNSSMNIINDLPDNSYRGGAAIYMVQGITISDNARLYADNSGQDDDTIFFYYHNDIMKISGNGILEINGNPYSYGVNLEESAFGTLSVNDNGRVIVNGSAICVFAQKIILNGGTMELNSCDEGVAIAIDPIVSPYADFEPGYFINGEIISEDPEGWEFRKLDWAECMAFGENWVKSYFVSVMQKETDK
ncbi:MAG: leucine-rich repeat domain-containing protein [Ruminococcaceae bacterium]|nr:leucine-rich repeat domain-containing protein [Oscillospiraceae bacterium]